MVGVSASTGDAFDARPPVVATWVAAAAGSVAVLVSAATAVSTGLGLFGLVVLTAGVHRGAFRVQTIGAAGLFAAVLTAGVAGTPPLPLLVATAGAVLAWDAGEHAIALGKHVGSRADARRAVLAHVGATAVVASAVGGLGFVVFRTARSGQPTTAVVLLLLAAVLFALVMNR